MAHQIEAALRVVAAVGPQAVVRWTGVPGRVHDGDGREAAVLRLAGKLHAAGVPQTSVEAICLFYNEAALVPELDAEVVIDRAGRYGGTPVVWPVLFAMARDLGAEVVRRSLATGDWKGAGAVWKYVAAYHGRVWDEIYSNSKETN
jgi:hypothetical protein